MLKVVVVMSVGDLVATCHRHKLRTYVHIELVLTALSARAPRLTQNRALCAPRTFFIQRVHGAYKHKGLVATSHSFCLFLFSYTIHTFIQSFTHNIR
jgi:hypothetical protein